MLLLVSEELSNDPRFGGLFNHPPALCPLSVVHPETHLSNIHLMDQLMQIKKKYDSMMAFLMEGGTFIASPKDADNLELKRIATRSETSKNLNEKGIERFQAQDMEAAEIHFKRAIDADPNFSESYNNLGVLYWQKGLSEEAFANIGEVLRRNPEDADAVLNFGNMCKIAGLEEEAKDALQSFLQRHPESEEVRKLLDRIEEESEWTEMKEIPWNGAKPS
jgi:tetratricopeptide (TPR) repeat protein